MLGLAALGWPERKAPGSIPDVGDQTVTSGLCQNFFFSFFPEELAGSSKYGSGPRAASGSNGIFLPGQSELGVEGGGQLSFYSPSPGSVGRNMRIKENQARKNQDPQKVFVKIPHQWLFIKLSHRGWKEGSVTSRRLA